MVRLALKVDTHMGINAMILQLRRLGIRFGDYDTKTCVDIID